MMTSLCPTKQDGTAREAVAPVEFTDEYCMTRDLCASSEKMIQNMTAGPDGSKA